MNRKIDQYLIELESKIQILERENETLSSKAEENLLLNRAFEEINVYDDIDSLMLNTLESISVLLNIQFSGIFDSVNNQYNCISSYALFSNEDTIDIHFTISEIVRNKLDLEKACFLTKSDTEYTFTYPNTDFIPESILIISLDSVIKKGRYFVFANDNDSQDLTDRIPLFVKIIRIISAKLERIYYQNELVKLNEELEQKVELRTDELNNRNKELRIAKEKAEESDRLKTAFLQNMSHEIRTPMNAIMGFSSLLAENFGNKSKLEEFSKIINQRCKDLLDIINDILEISKIESGLLIVNSGVCNIQDLFSELKLFFNEYQKRLNKQHISLCFKTPQSINSNFKSDAVKLKQILINLINNAFKFTNSGKIEIGYIIEGDRIIFYVSDTGIGISTEDQSKIFERFYQVYPGGSRINEGNGLGLSIVNGLVNLLGGQIWLESRLLEGSKFYFSFPYEPCSSVVSTAERGEYPVAPNLSNKTLLIVEDDKYNAEYLKEILINTGLKILTAINGYEAIQIATNQHVDLILLDIRLPDMTGYDAIYKIRQSKPQIKVIAQTAYAGQDERQKAIDSGCMDYISKPIKREILLTLVYKYLTING